MKTVLAAFVSVTLVNVAAGEEPMAVGRGYCQLFYGRQLEKVWERFSPEVRAAIGSEAALESYRDQVGDQLGAEVEVADETVTRVGNAYTYVRTARFEKPTQLMKVIWSFDNDERVVGFTIAPVQTEAASEYLDYQTKTRLRLPFEGEWYVFWGGRTVHQNSHAVSQDQRFAYDILIMKNGSSHTGEGNRNEDFHCFGKAVLAPAAGTVVAVEGNVVDNLPGEMNPRQAMGNHVILDHGNGEYSFFAHLEQGSVRAKKGARMETGEQLGLCGNSGNTSEPHVHYHLQDTPTFGGGNGLPPRFPNYVADGQLIERGEPVKGQTIQNGAGGSQ